MTTNNPVAALTDAMQACERAYFNFVRYGDANSIGQHDKARADFAALVACIGQPAAQPSVPTIEQATRMGEVGAPHSEQERMLYEAYCKGHCWAVGPWVISEKTGKGEYYEMTDRIRFAMWRDRAALTAPPADGQAQQDAEKAPTIEDRAHRLIEDAAKAGQVVRIDLVSRRPFAMGDLDMVVEVRPARSQS